MLTGAGSVPKFYVLDGQHRLETMGELKRTNGAVSAPAPSYSSGRTPRLCGACAARGVLTAVDVTGADPFPAPLQGCPRLRRGECRAVRVAGQVRTVGSYHFPSTASLTQASARSVFSSHSPFRCLGLRSQLRAGRPLVLPEPLREPARVGDRGPVPHQVAGALRRRPHGDDRVARAARAGGVGPAPAMEL